jgi:ribosomal-protein-alanine N-acetyltransferase
VKSRDDIVIDRLEPSDVRAVAELRVAAFGDTEAPDLARTIASLEEELGRPWARTRIARRGEAILGFAVMWLVADEAHVLDVATHPSFRRKGVGQALVRDLLAIARGAGALHVYLEVRRSNDAAIALYQAEGFAVTGVRARYYSNDEDALEMALAIRAVPPSAAARR